jgi:hypothetical protein
MTGSHLSAREGAMPKSRSKRTSAREYVKETPSHIVRIIERMEDALSEASDEPRRALIDVAETTTTRNRGFPYWRAISCAASCASTAKQNAMLRG